MGDMNTSIRGQEYEEAIKMIKEIPGTFKIKSPKHGGYSANIVSAEFDDNGVRKMVTYWEDNGKYGTEIYSGSNYVSPFSRKGKSYSRNFVYWKGMPMKWVNTAHNLRHRFQQVF